MQRIRTFALAGLACALTAVPASGQTLLNKLQNKLPGVGGAPAAAADASATPAPGYLGLGGADNAPASQQGVVLSGVKQGAPSDLGGLKDGDIVTAINGKPCRNVEELDAALAESPVGTKLTFTVLRGGKQETKVVTLGRRPIEAQANDNPGEAPLDVTPPADATPVEPLAPLPTRPAAEPTPSPPAGSPRLEFPAEPSATPPSLRPAANPLDPEFDPLARPGTRDPALELPAPPPADRYEPLAPAALPPAPGPSGKASLGISVVPLSDETRMQYDLRTSARQGAVIVAVRPGSAADGAGLPLGGVIVTIDGRGVRSSDDLVEAIEAGRPGQEVELRYYLGDRLATKTVRLAPAESSGIIGSAPLDRGSVDRGSVDRGGADRAPRLGLGNGLGTDRPALRRFEDLVDSQAPETPRSPVGSTILDPSRVAEMYEEIVALRETVTALSERLKLLESKLSDEAPATNP
ncbi:MAG: PDZ domain-containing protein [Pirellulaceae bacterium]